MHPPKAITKILSKILPIPKEYEKPIIFLRRHPITFLPDFGLFLVLSAIPLIAYYFTKTTILNLWATESGHAILMMGGTVWYLFAMLLLFTSFVDFFLDTWIVTNERVLDILQKGLFARTVNEARLYRVQNIKIDISGPLQTLLDFGDLTIETAGTGGQLKFDNIPNPNFIARKVLELVQADREYHSEKLKLERLSDKARIVDEGA